jgi:glycosyltransferase involved in cell wall biosynthesis
MIYLLCSTIRPKVCLNTINEWLNKSNESTNIKVKVVVDIDEHYNIMSAKYDTCIFKHNDTKGITKPLTFLTTQLTHLNDDDIVVVMSDDYFPPQNWDVFLEEEYKDYSGGINVYEGRPKKVQDTIVPLPIMDVATLRKLNYVIYHPEYAHMYSDNELHDNLSEIGLLKIYDRTSPYKFEHKHWSLGTRAKDTHDFALYKPAALDRKKYAIRKKLPLSRRLEYTLGGDSFKMLSILICSLHSRKESLGRLLTELQKQRTPMVEILVIKDDGELTIGKKRNMLLHKATGKYICFIDDDDMVSEDYISRILQACSLSVDCVGIEGIMATNGKSPTRFAHSIVYKKWSKDQKNNVYLRNPNHLNPVLRTLAVEVGFNDNKSRGEDKEYSDKLQPLLYTEAYINKPIYRYLFQTHKTTKTHK